MATEDAQYSLRVRSLRLTIALSVGLILLLFPIGDASAQEIRSGWEVVDSGTESNLMSAEYFEGNLWAFGTCLLYTSPSPRGVEESRMPSSA